MTTRIPPAHNHWPLASARYSGDPEPLGLPDRHQSMPLLWASLPCPPTWGTSGASSAWDLIREVQTGSFQVGTVENVIETAVWLTSQTYGE